MKSNIKKIILILAFTILTIGLVACNSSRENEQKPQDDLKDKTTLNFVIESAMASGLDPTIDFVSWYNVRIGSLETLFKFADDGTLEPWLAESAEVSEDNLTWTIRLKDNVKFSNGEDMTATKVKESIENLYDKQDPEKGGTGYAHNHFTYESITADDENGIVTIVTTKPVVDMIGCLAYPWCGIIDVTASQDRDMMTGPICTGPYVVVSNDPERLVKLQKNEHYWDGEVPFENVNIMSLPESSTRSMALQDGSADMAINISASDRKVLEEKGGYTLDVISGSRMANLFVNFDGILANDVLRQAILMAVDGKTVCDVTLEGSYKYSNNAPLPPNYDYGYESLTNKYSYNPEKAMQILDEANVVDTDGDGYREIDGKNVEIVYISSNSRQQDILAQGYASQIEKIGIKCNLSILDNTSELRRSKSFDLYSNSEITTPTGDPVGFLMHWYSKADNYNYGGYKSEEFDRLYESLTGVVDPQERKEIFTKIQQVMMDDIASITYGAYTFNICAGDSVTGVKCNPSDFYWITKDIKPNI